MSAFFMLALLAASDAPDHDLVASPPPAAILGKRQAVSLSIVPRTGARLMANGPVVVRVKGEGITSARPLYLREHAVDPKAEAPRFELAFSPVRAGAATLEADVTFYVCRGRRCRPVEDRARWSFEVAPR